MQERIIESAALLDGHWILGQGTIYPDTIESGGTAKAATIKTHHNRVPGIQQLMEAGRIVEPLARFLQGRSPRHRPRNWACPPNSSTAIRSPAPAWPFAACARKRRSRSRACPKAGSCRCAPSACRAIRRSYAPVLAIESLRRKKPPS